MPLEGTCAMQERFQAFPGTGRELTFSLSSALQGRDKFPLFVSPTSCRDHPGSGDRHVVVFRSQDCIRGAFPNEL